MFEDPEESPSERALSPADQAKEKADELRVHAQLAAVFEAVRKFDAQILPGLNADIAREIQRGMGKLEKSKANDIPLIPPESAADAAALLDLHRTKELSTNDYHIYRRPGEVMIVRWIEGDQVDSFYERLQAHFDAALEGYRDEEREAQEWKKDPATLAYLAALDKVEIKMPQRYLRDEIRKHLVYVLSTQSADEMDILHLCDYVMGVPAADVVGDASAPGDEPTEQDRAWFFKLFSLRGMKDDVEQMCFFTYLQKSDEGGW
jgi:hypothetical protein